MLSLSSDTDNKMHNTETTPLLPNLMSDTQSTNESPAKVPRLQDASLTTAVIENLSYYITKTRTIGVLCTNTHPEIVVKHYSRTEVINEKGMLLVGDISKRGTCVTLAANPMIRVIGAAAVDGAGWAVDVEAEKEVDVAQLFADFSRDVENCTNESYKEALKLMNHLVENEGAKVHIYSQECGIKIGVFKAPMDTLERRTAYAQLLKEANGKKEPRDKFNELAEFRWLVTEPYGDKPGYLIDDDGAVFGVDEPAEGRFAATAVYNKPDTDVDKDWIEISYADAIKALMKYNKTIPVDSIRILKRMCECIE